ncbi:MAG: outer membrane lipoprotein carrier protein LolA [Deltaproteobacteria bacterium]|nr:outer membrane lipoprotein carrier protein LolA [Deltaproteobacteria bacterium]
MQRTIYLLSLIVVLSLPVSAPAGEDVHSLMAKIQEKYKHLEAADASYTRDVITRSMSMMGMQTSGDLATGKLFFQFPHFIRMEQQTPTHEILVSDGDVLLWYVPAKKTLYKYPAEKFGKELTVLRDLFRGLDKAEKQFHIALLEPAKDRSFQLKLTPDPPWEQVDYLVISFSRSLDIQGLEIHNLLGSITRFTIEGLKAAGPFKKDFFKLHVPDDVKVIEEN